MTEDQFQKDAREAALAKARKERIEAEILATERRYKFMDLEAKFIKYACWCTSIAVGWVDSHGKKLNGNEAAAEKRVLAAAKAIDNTDENESLRALLCDILRCLRANMLRKKIVFDSKDAAEFENMLDGWSDRAAKIEKGNP